MVVCLREDLGRNIDGRRRDEEELMERRGNSCCWSSKKVGEMVMHVQPSLGFIYRFMIAWVARLLIWVSISSVWSKLD